MSDAYKEHYNQLTGAVITRFIGMELDEYGEAFPVLRARLLNGTFVDLVVSRDAEGNGGGHLFIYELEEVK